MTSRQLTFKRRKPVRVSPRVIDRMLERLIAGETMTAIGGSAGMPAARTLWRAIAQDEDLAEAVAEARKIGAGAMGDRLVQEAVELMKRAQAGDLSKGETASLRELSAIIRWYIDRHVPPPRTEGVKIIITSSLSLPPGPPAETAERSHGYTVVATVPDESERAEEIE